MRDDDGPWLPEYVRTAAPEPLARKPHAAGAFVNAANTDYTQAANRDKQRAALAACTARLGQTGRMVIRKPAHSGL